MSEIGLKCIEYVTPMARLCENQAACIALEVILFEQKPVSIEGSYSDDKNQNPSVRDQTQIPYSGMHFPPINAHISSCSEQQLYPWS